MLKYLILCACFIFSILACSDQSKPNNKNVDRYNVKNEPSDEFFLQRSYPEGRFSIDAYTQGLKSAQQKASTRTVGSFDQEWTTQGPGNIGARVNTIAVNPQNEQIIYAGFSMGGVFKTIDGGSNWEPIFDDQTLLAIGDIVLDPNDPEVVYVGTGDVNISGYPFIGDGLYKSENGGETWTNIGLAEQRIISKIAIDPDNPDRIFAACMGVPFERNNERGLYRTEDGGNNWSQVLFLSDSTGVIDLLLNPGNPDILYAAGWDRIRNNTESITRGQGARIYKSIDGGDNWTLLEGGLPNTEHSRIGLAMSGTNPNVLFAQYVGTNQQLEAIYKTTDGGNSWFAIPTSEDYNGLDSGALGGFGWYFGKIRVNPNNDNDLFLLGVDIWRTLDGGNNWFEASPPWWTYEVHADKHDLIYMPSGNILLATDGGIYRTDINNTDWEDIENIPTTQFYRVAYNPHNPDFYYGGAQDNGTTGGNLDGINSWSRIFGGDGFQMLFDPDNPNRHFVETQRGNVSVTLDGGDSYQPAFDPVYFDDRRNWDMPYFISSHNSAFVYLGTHKVYRGIGDIPYDIIAISDDLTDGTDEEHRYHNITALDESDLVAGLLYVGTGDGNVWRSDNDGGDWVEITDGLPDLYVTDVMPSPNNEDVVFVTFSGYRDNDFLPRIFKSEDRGSSWEDISADLPDLAINELLILPEHSDSILFVATDGGVYGTVDLGESWERLGSNMPFITVYDLVVNEEKNELVAGTFARSIMTYPLDSLIIDDPILSDIEPLAPIKNTLKIQPSLANDFINIKLDNTERNRSFEIVILNSVGQLLYQEKASGEQGEYKVDISSWLPGTYFVKAKMRHGVVSERFVKAVQ